MAFKMKKIAGSWHRLMQCVACKGMCWTQSPASSAKVYRCNSCSEPRKRLGGRTIIETSDERYNG